MKRKIMACLVGGLLALSSYVGNDTPMPMTGGTFYDV